MSEVTFRKDKYIFSSRNMKKSLNKKALKKEIKTFIRELKDFNIDVRSLTEESYSLEERNLILNIAYFLVDEEILLRKILNRKELNIKIVAKKTKISNDKIDKWSKYIIAYMILIYNSDYTNLATYLNINFKDLEALSVIKGGPTENTIYKGLVILEGTKSTIIMTKEGNFVRINIKGDDKVGEELSGKEKRSLKHYRKYIIGILVIFLIFLGAYNRIYNKQETTIIIQGTSKVKLGVNRFDKIVYSFSGTEKGNVLLTELNLKDEKFQDGIINILKGFEENNMLPPNRIVNVYIAGKMVDTEGLNKVINYVDSVNSDDNHKNNFKIKINNSGYEKQV